MYKIGISCIGGGVGQSIVNSCRLSRLPLKTIGLDTNPFAYGAYDCDLFDYAPSVSDENYITSLIDKCKKHDIDLIIPGLDDEILMYAQNVEEFERAGVRPLVSGEELIRLCRDKEKMSLVLNQIADVFVTSYDKNTLSDGIDQDKIKFPLIAKPRGGSASRGIEIIQSEDDLNKVSDTHIIQELAIPAKDDPNHEYYLKQIYKNENPQVSEISIQIVTDKNGKLLGKMASYNKLKDGIPIEIVPVEDNRIWEVVDELIPHFLELGLRGPLNIQGRLTEKGLKIFEMNPRFTGITGLRALMGFNEVESCIISWLDLERDNINLTLNYNRFGVRQTADKAVPIRRNRQVRNLSLKVNTEPEKTTRTLLIIGAGSYLGQKLIRTIRNEEEYTVWAYDHSKKKLASLLPQKEIQLYDRADYKSGKLSMGNIDVLLHLGFDRPHQNERKVADNLAFTNEFFTSAAMHHVPAIINISSKSVYGLNQNPLWDEDTPAAPHTAFAQAKYATELMLKNLNKINSQVQVTSLRFATVIGGDLRLAPVDLITTFVQKALNGEEIPDIDKSQMIEWLDIRDAIHAIKSVLDTPEDQWKPIYNIGSGMVYNIGEIAEMVIERAGKFGNKIKSEVITEDKNGDMESCMDNSLFRKDTGWRPSYQPYDTIDSLCRYFQSQEKIPADPGDRPFCG